MKVTSPGVVTLTLPHDEAQALANVATRSWLVSMRDDEAKFRATHEFGLIIEILGKLRDQGVRPHADSP